MRRTGSSFSDEHAVVIDVNRQACESLGYSARQSWSACTRAISTRALDAAAVARLGQRVARRRRR